MTERPDSLGEAREYYAETYDASVSDWPGELEFYLGLARQAGRTLELGAGTGRIAIRLAQAGAHVTALDVSPQMLEVGRAKSVELAGLTWVEADMRTFSLDATFDLVIVPGHAFQNLLTTADQLACLDRARAHLAADGRLVIHLDHQDIDWLGEICGAKAGVLEPEETFPHPTTGRHVRVLRAWSYSRSTQTATTFTVWEELDDRGKVVVRRQSPPVALHSVFRFEMEHLLGRAGFDVERLFGDFLGNPLADESSEMVFLARPV